MIFKTLLTQALFWLSVAIYVGFWIWAIIHALQTPRATKSQRTLWAVAMIANPSTAVWYWYIWKRWAFWALFTPVLITFFLFPLIVRSALTKADATFFTNILFALGSAQLVVLIATLMVFPLVLRLAALLHLGKNTELSAMDRNDWVVSLALPVFGYGAGIAYCARYRRTWAVVGLAWWVFIAISFWTVTVNVLQALVLEGTERRLEIQAKK